MYHEKKNDAKVEEELTCHFKIGTTIWQILTQALKCLKHFQLRGSFWSKYIMFELKNYRRVMFDGTDDWCIFWRKTDLCFQKWHEEFGKFA